MARRHGAPHVEDVDRPLAGADLGEAVAHGLGRDARRAPRAPPRADSPRASSAASVAECVQPAPCVAATSWRSTGISTCRSPSKRWSTASLAVAAGDDHRRRAELVRAARPARAAAPLAPGERLRLGQVRRHDRREREQPLDERLDRVVLEQPRARARDHHRVDDERHADARRGSRRPSRSARARRASPSSPRRRRCRRRPRRAARDELRRQLVDRVTAERVLRGERDEHAHPVAAGGGERLQVGLDAGAAAGVGAGDREAAWNALSPFAGTDPDQVRRV